MPDYSFLLTEHDHDKPWLIVSQEHRTITLDESVDFHAWAAEHWPSPPFTVQLDPQLPEWLGAR